LRLFFTIRKGVARQKAGPRNRGRQVPKRAK
jgi:hypothetical protein